MKFVKVQEKEWLEKQGYSKKIILDDLVLGQPGTLIQEVKIKAGETAAEHYHKKQTEIFYFLTKEGYWIINGKKIVFEIGDVLVIEPFDKHIVINDGQKDYVYLAFKINYDSKDIYWVQEKD